MTKLRLDEYQSKIISALDPTSAADPDSNEVLKAISGIQLKHATDIYRTNGNQVLARTLVDTYPTLNRLLGSVVFESIGQQYIRTNVGAAHDLISYGEEFPRFIADYHGNDVPEFTPDLASLEFAMHRAFYARDDLPIDNLSLGYLIAQDGANARISLRASATLLDSGWQLAYIRQEIEKSEPVAINAFSPNHDLERLIVYKHDFIVKIGVVENELWPVQEGIRAGTALGVIGARCEAGGKSERLGECLSLAAARQWLGSDYANLSVLR